MSRGRQAGGRWRTTASACENVLTPMTRSLPSAAFTRRRDVVYRDNERVGAGLDGSERLLLGAADGAHVAEQVELSGGRDPVAVEQRPAAQAVVDLEREGQAGRRPADAVDRVADVDGMLLDPDGVADRRLR